MVYNLLINGVYWGYNPFTNFQGDIQVVFFKGVGILPTLVSNFYGKTPEKSRHVSGCFGDFHPLVNLQPRWGGKNTTKDGSEFFG